MKKALIMMVCFVASLTALAQASAEGSNRVAEIRRMYKDAKSAISSIPEKLRDGRPSDDMVVTTNYMAPGAGPISDVTHYYFYGEYEPDKEMVYYEPYFVSRNYNVGAQNYYQELLTICLPCALARTCLTFSTSYKTATIEC